MNKETIIKGCENWVNNHKGENLLLAYSSIVELLDVLKEQEAKIEQLNRFVNGFSRDAMPVVRCKDCKYAPGNKEGYTCKIRDLLGMYMKNPDYFFCADGKRKY